MKARRCAGQAIDGDLKGPSTGSLIVAVAGEVAVLIIKLNRYARKRLRAPAL